MEKDTEDMRYLVKRKRGYYVQWPIPVELQKVAGKKVIVRTLKTRSYKEALELRWVAIGLLRKELVSEAGKTDGTIVSEGLLFRKALAGANPHRVVDVEVARDGMAAVWTEEDIVRGWIADRGSEIAEGEGHEAAIRFARIVKGEWLPLMAFIDPWMEYSKKQAGQTRAQNRTAVEDFNAYWLKQTPGCTVTVVQEIRRPDARAYGQYLADQGLSDRTVRRRLSSLSTYWKYLRREQDFVGESPWEEIMAGGRRGESPVGKLRPYSVEELKKLLTANAALVNKSKYGLALNDLVRLGVTTGARLDEMCSLTVSDIDHDKRAIRITKGKTKAAIRSIPLLDEVWPVIERRCEGMKSDDPVFPELPPGGPDQKRGWTTSKRFTDFRREVLGVESDGYLDFHSLRRSFSTLWERSSKHSALMTGHLLSRTMGQTTGRMAFDLYAGGFEVTEIRQALESGFRELLIEDGLLDLIGLRHEGRPPAKKASQQARTVRGRQSLAGSKVRHPAIAGQMQRRGSSKSS